MVYSVTYDLNREGQKYQDVIAELKRTSWARPTASQFLIATGESAKEVSERVARHLDSNDELLVIEVKDHYRGFLDPKVWEWVKEHLG